MPWKQESEFIRRDKAARVIQKAWKTFLNVAVFQHLKSLINIRRQGEPRQIVRYFNPKEAELLDAAAGIQVRFRLGGVRFPPEIYYKIFTHRHIEDLCANSPRNYMKLPAKHTSHVKSDKLQEEDHSGWYRRIENNGWRPVSDRFWMSTENVVMGDQKESKFHFSKLKRRQDMEKKRKIRKIEWMRQMYRMGELKAKATNRETLCLIHTATKGLIQAIEDGGIDSVMEWEVDEVLNWTNTLNFDELEPTSLLDSRTVMIIVAISAVCRGIFPTGKKLLQATLQLTSKVPGLSKHRKKYITVKIYQRKWKHMNILHMETLTKYQTFLD